MVQTKEEKAAYMKIWHENKKANMTEEQKEEKAAYNKIWREKNKERNRVRMSVYAQTPARIKSQRICNWKHKDIIVPDNNWNKFYDEYLSVEICQKKVSCNGCILTYDKRKKRTTKVVDHDHNITDKPNVKFICCHVCNVNDRVNNTSGEANIKKSGNSWIFSKMVKGITYYSPQSYKNIEDAINFKIKWLSDFKNGLIPSEFIV